LANNGASKLVRFCVKSLSILTRTRPKASVTLFQLSWATKFATWQRGQSKSTWSSFRSSRNQVTHHTLLLRKSLRAHMTLSSLLRGLSSLSSSSRWTTALPLTSV
jgi:hypothetical protein